jgi:autotransporter-associated beta strand protein
MGALLGLATNAVRAQTYTLLSDDFSRTGVLDGSTTTTGNAAWIANANVSTDGVQASTLDQNQNAYLPFTPKAGFIYTLTAKLNATETPGDSWGAFGFSGGTDTSGNGWFPGSPAYGWWLQRGNRVTQSITDQTFLGPGANNTGQEAGVSTAGYSTYQIVLDTTTPGWMFTFNWEGNMYRSEYIVGQPWISHVGFGANGTSMSVKDLSLTASGASINNPEYTWKGTVAGDPTFGSLDKNWVDSGNNPAVPDENGVVHLVFGAAGINGTTLTNNFFNLTVADPTAYAGGTAAPAIHFTAAAPAYAINGNALNVMGDIVNDSANVQTFDVALNAPGSFAINGNSGVALNGGANLYGLAIASTPGSQVQVTINSSNFFTSSFGEFQIGTAGTGALTLNGTPDQPVALTNVGALRIGGRAGVSPTGNGTMTVPSYSTYNQTADDITIGWTAGTSGLLELKGDGQFNFNSENANWMYVGIGGQGTVTIGDTAVLNTQGDVRFGQGGGSGRLTMTGGTFNSTGGAHGGWMYFGTDGSGTTYVDMSNGATINKTGGDIRIGNGGSTGVMTMTDTAQIFHNVPNWFIVGASGGNGTLTMSGHSTITKTQSDLVVGVDDGSTGKLVLKEFASLLYSGGDWTNIGYGNGAKGTLEVHDNATLTTSTGAIIVGRDGGEGTIVLDGVNPVAFNYFANILGDNGFYGSGRTSKGHLLMSGTASASFTNGPIVIGNHPGAEGYLEITGGASLEHMNVGEIQIGDSATGVMKVYGGTAEVHPVVINHGSMRVGHVDERGNPPGNGTLDLSGYAEFIELGTDMRAVSVATFGATGVMSLAEHARFTIDNGNFWLTWGAGGNGTLNLKGGVFESRNIISDGGTATINWQGGTFRIAAGGDASPFFAWSGGTETINVGLGANGFGAIVDTTNQNVTINMDLQHDSSMAGLDGGLTKIGPNSLTVNGTLNYTGNTTVNEGSLTVGDINTPGAIVRVATGTALNARSIVADTLTIGGAPIVINASAAAVPEPSVLMLLALAGLAFVGAYIRRK